MVRGLSDASFSFLPLRVMVLGLDLADQGAEKDYGKILLILETFAWLRERERLLESSERGDDLVEESCSETFNLFSFLLELAAAAADTVAVAAHVGNEWSRWTLSGLADEHESKQAPNLYYVWTIVWRENEMVLMTRIVSFTLCRCGCELIVHVSGISLVIRMMLSLRG